MKDVIEMLRSSKGPVVALLEAARWGEMECLKNILQEEALAVDSVDEYGCTALMLACSGGKPKIVAYLLKNNADPNAIDRSGNTALHWCLLALHPEKIYIKIIKLLLNHGATLEQVNTEGDSVLALAEKREMPELMDLLQAEDPT